MWLEPPLLQRGCFSDLAFSTLLGGSGEFCGSASWGVWCVCVCVVIALFWESALPLRSFPLLSLCWVLGPHLLAGLCTLSSWIMSLLPMLGCNPLEVKDGMPCSRSCGPWLHSMGCKLESHMRSHAAVKITWMLEPLSFIC